MFPTQRYNAFSYCQPSIIHQAVLAFSDLKHCVVWDPVNKKLAIRPNGHEYFEYDNDIDTVQRQLFEYIRDHRDELTPQLVANLGNAASDRRMLIAKKITQLNANLNPENLSQRKELIEAHKRMLFVSTYFKLLAEQPAWNTRKLLTSPSIAECAKRIQTEALQAQDDIKQEKRIANHPTQLNPSDLPLSIIYGIIAETLCIPIGKAKTLNEYHLKEMAPLIVKILNGQILSNEISSHLTTALIKYPTWYLETFPDTCKDVEETLFIEAGINHLQFCKISERQVMQLIPLVQRIRRGEIDKADILNQIKHDLSRSPVLYIELFREEDKHFQFQFLDPIIIRKTLAAAINFPVPMMEFERLTEKQLLKFSPIVAALLKGEANPDLILTSANGHHNIAKFSRRRFPGLEHSLTLYLDHSPLHPDQPPVLTFAENPHQGLDDLLSESENRTVKLTGEGPIKSIVNKKLPHKEVQRMVAMQQKLVSALLSQNKLGINYLMLPPIFTYHNDNHELVTLTFSSFMNKMDLFKQNYHLPEGAHIRIIKQIALGLQAIHNAGFAHCNLNAKNILLHQNPEGILLAKIADFDLVEEIAHAPSQLFGSRELSYWYPPEFREEGNVLGPETLQPSDIYAFGLIIQGITNISHLPKKSKNKLEAIYQRMLDEEFENRPSIIEVVETLNTI